MESGKNGMSEPQFERVAPSNDEVTSAAERLQSGIRAMARRVVLWLQSVGSCLTLPLVGPGCSNARPPATPSMTEC